LPPEKKRGAEECHERSEAFQSPAADALQKMVQSGEGCLPIVRDEKLIGMISRRDILHVLELKSDLTK